MIIRSNASYLYPRSSFVLARFLNVGHLRSLLDSHESPRVGVPVSILGHLTQVRPLQAGTSRQHLDVSFAPHSPTTAQPGLSSTSLAQSEYLLSKQMFPGYSVCSFGLVRASIQVMPSFPASSYIRTKTNQTVPWPWTMSDLHLHKND